MQKLINSGLRYMVMHTPKRLPGSLAAPAPIHGQSDATAPSPSDFESQPVHAPMSLADVFGQPLRSRSAAVLHAQLDKLRIGGVSSREQIAEAVSNSLTEMSMAQLEHMADFLPQDLETLVKAKAAKLEPGWFGALMHACFTRLRQTPAHDAATRAARQHALEQLFTTAATCVLDVEEPKAKNEVRAAALALAITRSPESILSDGAYSHLTRLKLFALVMCFQNRARDIRTVLLRVRRDALCEQLADSDRKGVALADRGGQAPPAIAGQLVALYERHVKRSVASLPRCDAVTINRHRAFIETERAWLQAHEKQLQTPCGEESAMIAIGHSLRGLESALEKAAKASSTPAPPASGSPPPPAAPPGHKPPSSSLPDR